MSLKKILIVESSYEMLSGKLKSSIKELESVKVVGHVNNSKQALTLTAKYRPDIVLMDIYLQGKSGVHVLIDIKKHFPETKVMMVSKYSDDYFRNACHEWGADYFFDRLTELNVLTTILKKETTGNNLKNNHGKQNRLSKKV